MSGEIKITFWGVRGSYPTPGPSTIHYGGNTSCTEIELDNGRRIVEPKSNNLCLKPE